CIPTQRNSLALLRLLEIHALHHPQVVERANHREHHTDYRQPDQTDIHYRLQHHPFSVEPDQERHAGHRHHDHHHQEGQPWTTVIQPLEIINALRFKTSPTQ